MQSSITSTPKPQYPQRAGRAFVQPAPSALGVRLPAQVRGLPEPDRALVEDHALLALKGRRFETWAEIKEAVRRATAYWNAHKHPFPVGPQTAPPHRAPPRDRRRAECCN